MIPADEMQSYDDTKCNICFITIYTQCLPFSQLTNQIATRPLDGDLVVSMALVTCTSMAVDGINHVLNSINQNKLHVLI